MNWKQGVMRVLLVLWGLWAGLGLVFVASRYEETQRLTREAEGLRSETLPPTGTDYYRIRNEFNVDKKEREARKAREALPRAWGLWTALCVAVPALLLGAVRWTWAGFEKKVAPQDT